MNDESTNEQMDIDAVFDHLVNNLGHDIEDELDWVFWFHASTPSELNAIAEELKDEFDVDLIEDASEDASDDEEGDDEQAKPMISALQRGALTCDDVKSLVERFRALAEQHGVTFEGVECFDPMNEQEIYGWFSPEDIGWRLSQLTESGLEEDGALPWVFLVETPAQEIAQQIAEKLEQSGFTDRDEFDEPDENGNYGLCIFVAGRNNEEALTQTVHEISTIVDSTGGELVGLQFYTREELPEVFEGYGD
ncbi:MAG: ribonuclease E inhibitor RraB [Pirellulaceae bacterium]